MAGQWLLFVPNGAIEKFNRRKMPLLMVYSQKIVTFAAQYSNVWPTKVHLAVLNWECE
jgi:hypothetical protein